MDMSDKKFWGDKPYFSLDHYLKQTFGEKVYRLSLNGGMTCPNRDGTLDSRGCIFCSAGGSGDFATAPSLSVTEQITQAKEKWGELSVLYAGGNCYADGLIDMAEALSCHVCEVCGKPGQLSEGDVLRTRCTEHR